MWISDEDLTLEGLGTAAAPAHRARRRSSRAGAALGWFRDRLATTPGAARPGLDPGRRRRGLLRRDRHRRRAVTRARGAGRTQPAPSRSWSTPRTCTQRCRTRTRPWRPGCWPAASRRPASGTGTCTTCAWRVNALSALDARGRNVGQRAARRSTRSPTSFPSTAGWSRPPAPTTARASRSAPPTCARPRR